MPLLTRNTCPSGCRTCISRTFQGMSVGGKVTSTRADKQSLWTSSTSSTQIDIQTPWSKLSSPSTVNVVEFAPFPRPPWPPRHRKISHSLEPTAPKLGGLPQSHNFRQPNFSNHKKLAEMSETFNIGVMCLALMAHSQRIVDCMSESANRLNPAAERGHNNLTHIDRFLCFNLANHRHAGYGAATQIAYTRYKRPRLHMYPAGSGPGSTG
jgi:hypothetical protein